MRLILVSTKHMALFNKIHIFESLKSHIYEPNISLTNLISLMFHYANPRILILFIYQTKAMTVFISAQVPVYDNNDTLLVFKIQSVAT